MHNYVTWVTILDGFKIIHRKLQELGSQEFANSRTDRRLASKHNNTLQAYIKMATVKGHLLFIIVISFLFDSFLELTDEGMWVRADVLW